MTTTNEAITALKKEAEYARQNAEMFLGINPNSYNERTAFVVGYAMGGHNGMNRALGVVEALDPQSDDSEANLPTQGHTETQTTASNKWDTLKQWIKSEIATEAARDEADARKAPNLYAYNSACGRLEALNRVLSHMELVELEEFWKETKA